MGIEPISPPVGGNRPLIAKETCSVSSVCHLGWAMGVEPISPPVGGNRPLIVGLLVCHLGCAMGVEPISSPVGGNRPLIAKQTCSVS
jgi:hypothetical protein